MMGEVIPILFITICLPLWIIFHYVTKWKMSKGLSAEDEKMLSEVWESTNRMEERINTLQTLKRKYGSTIEDVLEHRDTAAQKLARIEGRSDEIERLQHDVAEQHGFELIDHSLVLYVKRDTGSGED